MYYVSKYLYGEGLRECIFDCSAREFYFLSFYLNQTFAFFAFKLTSCKLKTSKHLFWHFSQNLHRCDCSSLILDLLATLNHPPLNRSNQTSAYDSNRQQHLQALQINLPKESFISTTKRNLNSL